MSGPASNQPAASEDPPVVKECFTTEDEVVTHLAVLEAKLRKNMADRYADHESRLGKLPRDCQGLPPLNDICVTLTEAARILGVSKPTVKRWFSKHPIPRMTIGGRTRISLSALHRWRAERENNPIVGPIGSDAGERP